MTDERNRTIDVLRKHKKAKGELLPILQKVQKELGYLPQEAQLEVAQFLDIPPVDVYDVVTFYNQFRLTPPGKHSVRVCLGTACHMKGGYIALDAWKRRLKVDEGQTTADREYDLDMVACVGCCTMAPVTVVDDKPLAQVDTSKVDEILLAFERKRQKLSQRSKQ
ncbi:MAG: NADH-quinone oxidoreductase subunit NuoE family protein [Thermoleophilia bacterium]